MPSSFLSNRLYECIGPTKFHHQISLLSTCILTCKNFQKFTWDFIWFALLWEFTDTILREITCWIPETENTFQSPSILIPSHPIYKKMCLFQRGFIYFPRLKIISYETFMEGTAFQQQIGSIQPQFRLRSLFIQFLVCFLRFRLSSGFPPSDPSRDETGSWLF